MHILNIITLSHVFLNTPYVELIHPNRSFVLENVLTEKTTQQYISLISILF